MTDGKYITRMGLDYVITTAALEMANDMRNSLEYDDMERIGIATSIMETGFEIADRVVETLFVDAEEDDEHTIPEEEADAEDDGLLDAILDIMNYRDKKKDLTFREYTDAVMKACDVFVKGEKDARLAADVTWLVGKILFESVREDTHE